METLGETASSSSEEEESSALSLDTILNLLLRYWYLIILAAAAGGAAAYYYAGSQPLVYEKTASVMLKDAKGGSDATATRILSEMGMDSGPANLANESYILKSTALMLRVVEALNLDLTYSTQQGFRQIDLYKESPILVQVNQADAERVLELEITPQDGDQFQLSYTNTAGEQEMLSHPYGVPVELPFGQVTVQPTPQMAEDWHDRPVYVVKRPARQAATALLANLTVTRPDEKDASILEMTLRESNPELAEDVLNQLTEAYNQRSKEERSSAALKTEQFIHQRLTELGGDLSQSDKQLQQFHGAEDGTMDSPGGMSADSAALAEVESTIFDLETQIKIASTLSGKLNETVRRGGLISLDVGLSNTALSSKIEAYNEAYLEFRKISVSAGSQNPIIVALRDKMNATLASARQALDNFLSNEKLKLSEWQKKQQNLRDRQQENLTRAGRLSPVLREHKVKEELYMLLLTKEQENALTLAIAEPSAHVLETAHGSDAPVAPRSRVITAGGAAGGAALCLLALTGLTMLNRKVRNKHDLAGYSNLPVVAELPHISKKERGSSTPIVRNIHSNMAECLHILCNNVDNLLPLSEQGGHIIMLTSTMPGEGKTFVSSNLAATYARVGKRVLVIDADLRKASLTKEMGGKGYHGLTSILLNKVSHVADVIHPLQTDHPEDAGSGRADILYAGPRVPNPVTLLTQPRLEQLIHDLQKQYDAIIIDAPPYGMMADTDLLASHAEITLYLVRSGLIDKRYMRQIQKLSQNGKLPHLAYVINAVNFKASSYHYYGYGYGYGNYGYGAHKDG